MEAIHRYKYNQAVWLEPFLIDVFLQRARPAVRPEDWDVIIPVPLHPTKLREREFNQAARLALGLSSNTSIPMAANAVRRLAATPSQTRLSREERFQNMQDAFSPLPGNLLEGKRAVLVDDVFTTGATTNACAEALLAGGAAKVCVWTLARGT